MIVIISLAAFVVIIFMTYISVFNSMKRNRNQIENAKSSLDALFIKRNDMIPNLVSVLQEYTAYEKEVLEKITALRQSVQNNPKDYQAEGDTDRILKQLMVQVEKYPELKANQQFNNLQYAINECEEQIAAGRRYLSASITVYNDSITTFPGNIIAGMNGMYPHEWERATAAQRENVDVKNLFGK